MIFFSLLVATSPAMGGEMDLVMKKVSRDSKASSKVTSAGGAARLQSIPCFVKATDVAAVKVAIGKAGGIVGAIAGDVLSAQIPIGKLDDISNMSEVVEMEFASPLSDKMDTARAQGEVDVVQNGHALGIPYDGKDVVIGIVDDALDYGHPDFIDEEYFPRVQYMTQTYGGETRECTVRTLTSGDCDIEDGGQGRLHGTHVAGIAAGNNDTYMGVAPAADIMFAFLNITDAFPDSLATMSFGTAVLDGVSTIFSKADIMDKAAVVNLSLGTSLGAHDGTSLLEEGLSELSSEKPGRIIVGAAGNEQVVLKQWPTSWQGHIGGIHATIGAVNGTSSASRFVIWNGMGSAASFLHGTAVDLWLDVGDKDSCRLAIYGYEGGRADVDFAFPGIATTDDSGLAIDDISFSRDGSASVVSDDGAVKVDIDVDSSDIRNDKPHALILFTPNEGAQSISLEDYWYDVVIRADGGNCSGHMWLYYDYTYYHDYLRHVAGDVVGDGGRGDGYSLADGDSLYTMTIPATADGVIAVGSWLQQKPIDSGRSQWKAINGETYAQNNIHSPGGSGSRIDDLSAFSSLGPAASGRNKPEIVAPGEPIISAKARGVSVSSSIEINDLYYKSAGTSMSAPYVTGVIALLLQRNNTLTTDDVREIVGSGASTSGLHAKTEDPRNSYGAGKINAAAMLASVPINHSAYHGTGDLEGPQSGCEMSARAARHPLTFLFCVLPLTLLVGLRVRRFLFL